MSASALCGHWWKQLFPFPPLGISCTQPFGEGQKPTSTPSQCWDPFWLEPVQILCMVLQSLKFISVCREDSISLGHSSFLAFLPQGSLNLERKGLMKVSHLGLCFKVFHSLIVHLWVSVISIYYKKQLLWWGLNNILICEYSNMSLGVILLLCSFCRIIVFPLGPWLVQSQVLGHFSDVSNGFHLME